MLRTSAETRMRKAIHDQDWETFKSLVDKRVVSEDETWMTLEAMRWGDPRVVQLVGHYFSGPALARALNLALETQRQDWVEDLVMRADARPRRLGQAVLDRQVALQEAIGAGQIRAMEALLTMGASWEGLAKRGCAPLEEAARHDHVAMFERLLPLFPDQSSRDDALWVATESQAHGVRRRLWPLATAAAQNLAAHLMAREVSKKCTDDGVGALAEVLAYGADPEGVTSTSIQAASSQAFAWAMEQSRWEQAALFLPWLDPNHEWARPLCLAIQAHRPELVEVLLPKTDVALARQFWTRQRPARWDWVDALTAIVDPDPRQAWLGERNLSARLPQALAAHREDRARVQRPAPHVIRMRRRP